MSGLTVHDFHTAPSSPQSRIGVGFSTPPDTI